MSKSSYVHGPNEGPPELWLGGQGVDYMVRSSDTESRIAIVEQPLEPGRMVPPHQHHDEDELSYVLEGEIGYRIGDEEGVAPRGSYVWKPRNLTHTIWNATDRWVNVIEIIIPGGFEEYYREIARLSEKPGGPHMDERAALGRKYNIEYFPEWAPELMDRHGVRLPGK